MSVTSSIKSRASVATVPDASFTMVAALDVGTAYSGYAYAYRKEMDEGMDNVIVNNPWSSADKSTTTYKTPTQLLLNEKREFEAFGYEAQKRYAELHQQGRHERCFYFKKFRSKIASGQAGIPGEALRLALESEVASVYCQNMKGVGKLPIHSPGCTYVVADIGGGITDIVLHQKRTDGRLKEMNKGGGCLVGSSHVENSFLQFLVRIFGAPAVREFLDECQIEVIDILKQFEMAKKGMISDQAKPLSIGIPVGLERICRKKNHGEDLSVIVQRSMYRDKAKLADNTLHIDVTICREFFNSACLEIAKCIRNVLLDHNAKECTMLILVGGMASSTIVQDILKQELESKTKIQRIIVPPEPELAVLKVK
ncbi:heat shock 70 kDa protein 12B-like [Dreissena polymorpha]|uniref:heat shock 70 kDa protein 12B-like n=1 Tax=Dreissena polymorpha TaxID=45954 RepID=UPI002263DD29|nr:heat shock 70 kDa protein 12B-like [Dreissena polymorpha]